MKKTFNHEEGKYFETGGAKIYYEEIGNKDKKVLVILHGGLENIENMNSLASYLAEDFRIIGIDSRGHGKSTLGSKKLTYERIQLDAEEILEYLDIKEFSLIGFSDGGIVSYRIAASKKFQINKLVTIAASWNVQDVIDAEDMVKSITPESAKEFFPENYESYEKLNEEADFDKLINSVVDMWLDKEPTGHPNESVKNISAETLIIKGDNDFLVSTESLAKLKNEIPNSWFMNVPFAEHLVHEEQAEMVKMVLEKFLLKAN